MVNCKTKCMCKS